MAALSNTCRRISLRLVSSKFFSIHQVKHSSIPPCVLMCSQVHKYHFKQFSTSFICASSSENTQKPESTLPFSVLLKQAEEKEKNTKEDEEKKKKERKEKFAKYQKWALYVTGTMLAGISVLTIYELGEPRKDENGQVIPDEFDGDFPVVAYLKRAYKEMRNYRTMIVEPSAEKLLPDPLTEPYYQPPYTLVLEMTNVLVHPEWTYSNGWRFKKRPGVDYFLQQVGPPMFEIVIYTSEQGFTAFPLLDSLDPKGYIMYRLFRDATKYVNGHHIKDLSCLNRDMSRVIFVDHDPKSFQLQPQNAVRLKKWDGNDDDRTLFDLAAFLRTIAMSEVEDVRPVLDFYTQHEDPLEAFKQNQARLQAEQERLAQAKKESPNLAGSWSSRLLGR
ncbi:Mitochondrial import inner membrane translocase subunit TIM50 [Holothuria leucospilota]|uniref:Mitochondrial import inner membrane translocase subunit TIM50 n=1 Tax=Holothuria leucospilota TaxID=206669 RepID=A0A9Q1HHA4_HOLLE|nr:Mitochondrial import inner membrane translocase subunit TIM50 [Holothuria leucospilota]